MAMTATAAMTESITSGITTDIVANAVTAAGVTEVSAGSGGVRLTPCFQYPAHERRHAFESLF